MELRIDTDQLKKCKLFVGTPMYGGQCTGLFARSTSDLSSLCTHYGIQLQLYYLFNESLITRARNYICDEFMRSDATHLMFIDADIGFDARDIIALMALSIQNPAFDIIGGPYPKKCISWEKIKQAVDKGLADKNPNDLEKYVGDYVFNPIGGRNVIPLGEPAEVLEVGTGFMMIRRNTMEKFKEAYEEDYKYRPDHVRTEHFDGHRHILQFFQAEIDRFEPRKVYRKLLEKIKTEIESDPANAKDLLGVVSKTLEECDAKTKKDTERYLSEDYWFTQKCQAIGLRTWLCPWMRLQHLGAYVFAGSLADLAAAGASPTADVGILDKSKERNKPK